MFDLWLQCFWNLITKCIARWMELPEIQISRDKGLDCNFIRFWPFSRETGLNRVKVSISSGWKAELTTRR